jgi:hypothetical protein
VVVLAVPLPITADDPRNAATLPGFSLQRAITSSFLGVANEGQIDLGQMVGEND